METQTTNSVLRIFLSSIRNIISACHHTLRETLTSGINLPLSIRYKITSAEKCTVHINRILNIFDGILDSENLPFNSFDPQQLLERLSNAFIDTISGYADVDVSVYSGLKFDYPLMTNKDLLELTILNLLYASLRNADTQKNKKIKFALYLSSNRHSITIHIRDNCAPIDPQIMDSILSGTQLHLADDSTFESVIAFSLNLAKLSSWELKGRFDYRALKSGNRFDIILPKISQPFNSNIARSPRVYTPNMYYFKKVFEDLLENEAFDDSKISQE